MNYIFDRLYIPLDNITDIDAFQDAFSYTIDSFNKPTFIRNWSVNNRGCIVVPSGSMNKALPFLRNKNFEDKNTELPMLSENVEFNGQLWGDQEKTVDEFMKHGANGFINSRAGSGKTVMACNIISRMKQKTLVIVPTTLLLNQWEERINQYIPNAKVGKLGDGFNSYDESTDILVAIINSLRNTDIIKKFRSAFSVIIMDEAHRLPADSYSATVNLLAAKHKIGLSANTTRKDQKHIVIADYLGDYVVVNENPNVLQAKVVIVYTGFDFSFNPFSDHWAKTLNNICGNEDYNRNIADMIRTQAAEGRKIAVLSPRLFQLEQLESLLSDRKVGVITGQTKSKDRDRIIAEVNAGNIEILLCSKQIFEEGADIKRLDTIHLVAPSNNDEKLEQALGRIERPMEGKRQPLAYDYWFTPPKRNSLTRQQDQRMQYYLSRGYELDSDAFSV